MPSCGHHGEYVLSPIAQLLAEHEIILRALTVLEQVGQDLDEGKTADSNMLVWLSDFFQPLLMDVTMERKSTAYSQF